MNLNQFTTTDILRHLAEKGIKSNPVVVSYSPGLNAYKIQPLNEMIEANLQNLLDLGPPPDWLVIGSFSTVPEATSFQIAFRDEKIKADTLKGKLINLNID